MDCADAKLRMDPYAADELSGAEKAAFESHLSDCAECRLDSELTRASKNAPTASPPRPSAPEAAPRPSAGEWTIESIFGSATGAGAGTSSAPSAAAAPMSGIETGSAYTAPTESGPAAEPPPADEPEILLPDVLREAVPARAGSAEGADANGTPGWKFESADAKEVVTPPEGSLFFAEEVLSRTGTPAKAKSSFLRVVLWGAGGIVGLALLGISIWVALTLKPPTSHVSEMSRAPAASVSPASGAPAVQSGAEAPGNVAGSGGLPERTGAALAPEAAPVPSTTAVAAPPRTSHNAETASRPAVDPSPAPPPSRTAETTPPPSAAPSRAAPPAAEAAPERPLWEPAIREEPSVQAPPRRSEPAGAPTSHPGPSSAPTSPARESQPPSSPLAESPAAAPPPAPKPKPAPAPAPTAQETAPPSDPIQRPIDRLHLATLTAEQNADLTGLRKMRETWKTFLKTSVGPDRARAKRELGDCLWAVQILTASRSDQKAALAAYRDYLLNAPAGGADVRTVSRMRQLEDALAESH